MCVCVIRDESGGWGEERKKLQNWQAWLVGVNPFQSRVALEYGAQRVVIVVPVHGHLLLCCVYSSATWV